MLSHPIIRPVCLAFLGIVALSSLAHAQSPTLERIAKSGAITLGYRESSIPFSYLNASQQPVGLSIDLCRSIAAAVKEKLKLPNLAINYVAVNASNRIPLIQNGTIDIECGSTTNTAERQKQVAFSVATFVVEPNWLVSAESGITNIEGLKGKTVVITQGSLNLPIGERLSKELGLNLVIIQAKEQADSLLMLRTGRAAAWFEDNILQAGLVANAPNPKAFKVLQGAHGALYFYGLMMAKDDPGFKALVDGVISAKMASGEFDRLYDTWFMQPIPPSGQTISLPMSDAMKARVAHPSDALTP